MAETVRVGVVGCGNMGTHLAEAWLKVPKTEIAGVYDVEEAKARILASKVQCDYYTRLEDLLNHSNIDAAIVATPNHTHCEVTVAALKASKHVFCEKPMALKIEDCDLMIAAAEKSGLTLMIGHVMRFYPGCSYLKRAISKGEIGSPILGHFSRTGWITVGSWSQSWRRSQELCGNSLFESTIHEIDLMRWFMGDVESVQAHGSNFAHPELEYDDCNVAILRFKNGALGTLESGYAFRLGEHMIKVNGTAGAACIDFKASTVEILTEDGTKRVEPLRKAVEPKWLGSTSDELKHFLSCMSEGRNPLSDGREGRCAVEIATAINRSAMSGKPVKMPL